MAIHQQEVDYLGYFWLIGQIISRKYFLPKESIIQGFFKFYGDSSKGRLDLGTLEHLW